MVAGEEEHEDPTVIYKIKVVQFLGRSVPIILQNDNGPCPLLAICNVLLLRNNLSINPDMGEIPLQTLLVHVAEKLLDSNSNSKDKDDEYTRNQQQNISDAITLLPRLATGIDVNVRFRHIHDFEFTPACAIFDLLDIGLVHGWLCDPQDETSCRIIGDNSYNVLVEKLVALESSKPDSIIDYAGQETSVDFAAATTASLGIPSPSLSLYRIKSLGGLDLSSSNVSIKGNDLEAAQLLQALELSETTKISDFSNAIEVHRLPSDDALPKKQENSDSLSSRWVSTGKPEESGHDVDSSNHSIDSGENSVTISTCPPPNPTSSSGLVDSIMVFEHDKTSPEDLVSNKIAGQDTVDSVDTNLQTQEQSLADRRKQNFECSVLTSDQKEEDLSNRMSFYGSEAILDATVNPQHETQMSDKMKHHNERSTLTSDLKMDQSETFIDLKDSTATSLEEHATVLAVDESSRLSLADNADLANCLFSADASQSTYQSSFCPVETEVYDDAAQVQILEKDEAHHAKQGAVVGSGNRLELSGKKEFLITSDSGSVGVDLLPEENYPEDAREHVDTLFGFDSKGETLYEGEALLADTEALACADDRELLYEGEGLLMTNADEKTDSACSQNAYLRSNFDAVSPSRNDVLSISASEGFVIENFLLSHASQLTYYGLFSLQEGLKERELCVFFRNNHFSTMFKYEGDLYLLATDQGYLNQPDLVWEKLTEVGGDSIFYSGSFSLFKADENHGSWNEQDVVKATKDYVSAHQKGATDLQDNGQLSDYNTDFQLAMALQQEELDQQQQQQQQQNHIPVSSPVPPQRSQSGARSSTALTAGEHMAGTKRGFSSSKAESKIKDKCVIM